MTRLRLQNLKRDAESGRDNVMGPPRHRPGQKFLKGPIPLTWLTRAAALPGKSLHVGLTIWFLAGLTQSRTVKLSSIGAASFGVDRYAKYRALRWLEEAGLIVVDRKVGRSPRVTLIDIAVDF